MSNKYNKPTTKQFTRSEIKWRVAGVVALFLICLLIVFPSYANRGIDWVNNKANLGLPTLPAAGFNLGLDLQGGAHLIYQAQTDKILDKDRASAVEGVRDVIERRVRGGLGVAEPLVQTTLVGSDYRIIVELPGVTDVNTAIKMIGETPVLEFKEENNEPPRSLTADEQKQLADFNKAADHKINEAFTELRQGADFGTLVTKYTEDEKSKNNFGSMGFVTADVAPEIYAWASTHKEGDISTAVIKSAGGLNLLKRMGERTGDKRVAVSHLLICYKGADGCDNPKYTQQEAQLKIAELKKEATPANFTALAKQYSTEPGAAQKGGDLGWVKKGQTVPEFEKAMWDAPANTVIGPVETKYGYHLILKTGEDLEKQYEVARVFVKTKSATDIVPPTQQWKSTGLSGKQLKKAEVNENSQNGNIEVSLQFDDEGTKLFGDITTRNTGKQVAIFLDGTAISVPRVNEPIVTGNAVITGSFTLSEAKLLSQRLNSGALPVPVELISQEKVDATLGASSLYKSVYAGLIGFALVVLFMILYYRFPGLMSVFALAVYAALSLAIFKLIGATLTLSGIAGFVLSVGMAVDANVLVFERLKEELTAGKSLRAAMEESFMRAWPSIRDSNITTLISCVFLVWFGGGFVQGFAVTLAIGVLVSMFTAVTVTRTILRFVIPWFKDNANWMFLGHKSEVGTENK